MDDGNDSTTYLDAIELNNQNISCSGSSKILKLESIPEDL